MQYHYIMTLEFSLGEKFTIDGVVTVHQEMSRKAMYYEVVRVAKEGLNRTDTAVVLFYSLEPNQL